MVDKIAASHRATDVSQVLVDVVRRKAADYLDEAGLANAVRAVDFPHLAQILSGLDALPTDLDLAVLLELFLDDPRALGVGPNPHFDESFYQLEYADVRASVLSGHLHCGYFHYVKYGLEEGRWPNRALKHTALHKGPPLPVIENVEDPLYLQLNPGAAAFLEAFPFMTPLAHYNALGRRLHMRVRPDQVDLRGTDRLEIIYAAIRSNFDPAYYRARYLPECSSEEDLLSHYIENAGRRGHSPNADFDEEFYCAFYKEVREAVESGRIMSGFYHYIVSGSGEGRLPRFDLRRVLDLRMPGVTTPTLLHRTDDIRRRCEKLSARSVFRLVDDPERRHVWFLLPTMNPDITFGGYRAAFELIIALRRAGYRMSILCTEDAAVDKRYFLYRENAPRLRQAFEDIEVHPRSGLKDQELGTGDIVISYSVWDLHIAAEMAALTRRGLPFLLAQEYEPIFYDNSSIRVICESRYDIPHVPIINSRMLESYLRMHEIGVFKRPAGRVATRYAVFEHKINRLPSATIETLSGRSERLLALYARPEGHAARNLFEIAVLALQAACQDGVFGPEWRFIGLGALADVAPIALGGGHTLHLHQKMAENEYVANMRNLDIGLSLMYAPHPSVVPSEFATTGALVVTNVYENRSAEDLTAICRNFIPCGLSIEAVVAALRAAVSRVEDFEARIANILQPPTGSWEEIFSPSVIASIFREEPRPVAGERSHRPIERRLKLSRALSASAKASAVSA